MSAGNVLAMGTTRPEDLMSTTELKKAMQLSKNLSGLELTTQEKAATLKALLPKEVSKANLDLLEIEKLRAELKLARENQKVQGSMMLAITCSIGLAVYLNFMRSAWNYSSPHLAYRDPFSWTFFLLI